MLLNDMQNLLTRHSLAQDHVDRLKRLRQQRPGPIQQRLYHRPLLLTHKLLSFCARHFRHRQRFEHMQHGHDRALRMGKCPHPSDEAFRKLGFIKGDQPSHHQRPLLRLSTMNCPDVPLVK